MVSAWVSPRSPASWRRRSTMSRPRWAPIWSSGSWGSWWLAAWGRHGVLSGGIEHRDLRHHDHCSSAPAGRPFRTERVMASVAQAQPVKGSRETAWSQAVAAAIMVALLIAAPFVLYPVFLMKALCFALFACAFNLLIGYVGLVSFGHALYFGWAGYVAAHAAKVWGLPPELAVLAGTATGMALGLSAGVVAIR